MNSHPPSSQSTDSLDGRLARRERNENAVRAAILDMLATGDEITPTQLARRSSVAIRTIYRRFSSVQGAIDSTVEKLTAGVEQSIIDSEAIDGTLAERTVRLVEDRLAWLRSLLPVVTHLGFHHADALDQLLLADIERRFVELQSLPDRERKAATTLLGVSLRFSSLAFLCDAFDDDHDDVTGVLVAQVDRCLNSPMFGRAAAESAPY